MATLDVFQYGKAQRGGQNGAQSLGLLDSSGAQVVVDFFAKAMLDDLGHQIRAGTLTTPLVGDVVITDTAAEYCLDPAQGKVCIPVYQNISIRLGGGTLHEYATKAVATASSAGTAYLPLPMNPGAARCSSTARVQAAGSVTVTAELATTTQRYWSFSQPIAMGAYVADCNWMPLRPPTIAAGFCLYTQVAATGTGPSYYANLDFLELNPDQVGF